MGVFDYPPNDILTCSWSAPNHILFQIANSWLCVLYIGDFITFPSSKSYLIFLRVVLLGCALFFAAWAMWVLCSPDTALWNILFMVYNLARLIMLLYRECNSKEDKPRFERLYNASYKTSGLSVETYNTLIEGGTVIAIPLSAGNLNESIYSPGKVVQIISGRIFVHLRNGSRVKLREGDIINHEHWNFSSKHGPTSLVDNYSAISEALIITWSHARLSELLRGTDRRLYSCLLLSSLNTLLLHLTSVTFGTSALTLTHSSAEALTAGDAPAHRYSVEAEESGLCSSADALLLRGHRAEGSDTSVTDSGIMDNTVSNDMSNNKSNGETDVVFKGNDFRVDLHAMGVGFKLPREKIEYVALLESETGL